VLAPLLRRPLAMAAGLAVAVSLGEFGATSFVSRTDSPTVPIVIGRLLGRPGAANLGQALALSCLLAVTCAAVFGVMDLVAEGRTGEF
jgi:thiamine transport system permease protein